jgi:multiple sugar transport system substrate-binding protein
VTRSRRLIVLAAALTLALASSVSPVAGQAPSDDGRRVDLTFMNWFYQGDMQAAYDEFIESYKQLDPRVQNVLVEEQPFVRYHDVMNVKLAGNNPPDVAWIHASLQDAYIDAGRLRDLRPYLESLPDFDLDDFTPSSLAKWSRGDALYALPFTNATNVVFYNKDIFEQAGLPTPLEMEAAGEWTWENLAKVSKQLVDSGAARYGFHFGNNIYTNGWRNLVEIWGPYGGGPWSEDGTTCRFNAPETVAATQLVHDMIFKDKSHPEPGIDVDFATGDVGMSLTRPNFAFRWKDGGFEWDVVRQPDGPMGYVPSLAQNGIAVFADSPNPDIAEGFLAHTLTRDNAIRFQVNTPSNRASTHTPEILTQAVPDLTPEQMERTVVKALHNEQNVFEYAHRNFGPLFTNSHQIFDGKMWKADADVQAVSDEICEAITPLLG